MMAIRVDDFADSERQFADQLNSQIEQVSRSLMHLDKLLVAGLVDRRVLTSFREAVDRVRTTGFVVQQAIEGTRPTSQITEALLVERVLAEGPPLVRARQEVVAAFEERYLETMLARHGGVVTRAAAAAGIARRHFHRLRARPR